LAQDILQRFLSAKLFDVGGDDSRLAKLREAASDLSEQIKTTQQRLIGLTMVAIDAKTPANNPILLDIAKLLEKRWHSYAGAFSDSSLPVVMRAIVLEALGQSIGADAVALSVATTARNLLPHLGSPSDRELWIELIEEADRRLETRARREWALPSAASAAQPAPELPPPPRAQGTVLKRDGLVEKITAASGPSDVNGAALAGGNPYAPNQGQPWSNEFAPRASKAIADAIDTMAHGITERVNAALAEQSVASALVEHSGRVAESLAQTTTGLERRTSMLWWKEALYSPAVDASYRDMGLVEAAAWAAVDVVDMTGPYAPRMAEAFLVETLRMLDPTEAMRPLALASLIDNLAQDGSPRGDSLRVRLSEVPSSAGRTPLASLVAAAQPIGGKGTTTRARQRHAGSGGARRTGVGQPTACAEERGDGARR